MTQTKRFALATLLMLVAAFTFLDSWTYSQNYYKYPEEFEELAAGHGLAPAQYRVGIIFVAKKLKILHLGYRHSFALIDFICAMLAGWFLLEVMFKSQAFLSANPVKRWLHVFIFLGLVSYYLSWACWYQRPETMSCALYVAASLYVLSVFDSTDAAPALLMLTALQAFVRADVAILFNLALAVYYVAFKGGGGFVAKRSVLVVVGIAGLVMSVGILWVLMHVVYPNATYGDTAVFQIKTNLRPSQWIPFLLFFAPTLYTYLHIKRELDHEVKGAKAVLLLASTFYLISYALMGRLQEVRIFLPFAFALMPQTASTVVTTILNVTKDKYVSSQQAASQPQLADRGWPFRAQ